MRVLESKYQRDLIRKLSDMFPGCTILKNDTDYIQGIPDLTILYQDKWAVLEVKASEAAPNQPNQEYYVSRFNEMSFSAFIHPNNEEEVLDALQQALRPRRPARVSKS